MIENCTETLIGMRRIYTQYAKTLREVGNQYGLSQIETDIIGFLECNPTLNRAKDIVDLRGYSKGNVSQGIEHLEEKGYIKRTVDLNDHRIFHLELEEHAQEILKELETIRAKNMKMLFHGLSEEERNQFEATLKKIFENTIAFEEESSF